MLDGRVGKTRTAGCWLLLQWQRKTKRDPRTPTATAIPIMNNIMMSNALRMISLPALPHMPLPSPSWTHQAMISLRNSHAFTKTAHWVIPGVLLQGQRPEAHEIRKIVTEANCSTFVCLQAECAPE
eukprot:380254_1